MLGFKEPYHFPAGEADCSGRSFHGSQAVGECQIRTRLLVECAKPGPKGEGSHRSRVPEAEVGC